MRSYQAGIVAGARELGEEPAESSVAPEQPMTLEQGLRPHIVTDPRPTLEIDADDLQSQ